MARFVIEGEWSGYRSSQSRIVHREVITEKRAERVKNLSAIVYTDGTCLYVSVRKAEPRERIQEIHGYSSLIRQAEATGKDYVTVAELNPARAA
ncbi:hypothetical protein M5E06_17595 [Azospirillum sp. A1-3]|uniref:hypothetical protein n=1 Tax=Azospirillum sp. A1-3 TaxID=185874 RepID=UPI002076E6E6|nr:hypothetical protein [Azospirillum sp. A1-3]MCM8735949.1 hypothetical protein [Azospirillum sp. A1-3]